MPVFSHSMPPLKFIPDHENFPCDCSLTSYKDDTDEDLSNREDFEGEEFTEDVSEEDWKVLI